MSMTLQTQRLILRRPAPGDWAEYRDFMTTDRAAVFSSSVDAGTAWKSFAAELGHWDIYGHGMWAVTLRGDQTAIGLVGPWTPPHWPENEIGWMMLSADAEGKGIAFESAQASLTHAFDVLGWDTAVSYIWPDNTRSIRLAEKMGAMLDTAAKGPNETALVYRHPRPEGTA